MRSKLNPFSPLLTFLLFLSYTSFVQAQDEYTGNTKLIIIKKVTNLDGTERTTKITREGDDIASEEIDQLIEEQITDDLKDIDVNVDVVNAEGITTINVDIQGSHKTEKEEDVFLSFENTIPSKTEAEANTFFWNQKDNPDKPLLGVVVSDGPRDGVLIESVMKNSGSEIAGLQKGDVILKVEGEVVNDIDKLLSITADHQVGDSLDVIYIRNNSRYNTSVTLMKGAKKVNTYYLDNIKVVPRVPNK